ncbi:MAG: FkbM family methyltransferase [Hyphomonadaceae bacterium]|nr:FkbM family methyltransferase [Hyphomonadaceae bacterium]
MIRGTGLGLLARRLLGIKAPEREPETALPAHEQSINAMPAEGFGLRAALAGLSKRGFNPGVVYDVGASDGILTRVSESIWPSAKYVCFEPLQEHKAALEKLTTDYPGKVQIVPVGLGDADAELTMGVSTDLLGSSFAYEIGSERTLPVRRLDGLLATGLIPPPNFMKLDVQGFELRVLAGGAKALETTEVILMECQFFAFCQDMRTLDETILHMRDLGYVPYEFVDFMRRPLDDAMGQCDLIFVKRGHPLISNNNWA